MMSAYKPFLIKGQSHDMRLYSSRMIPASILASTSGDHIPDSFK